MILEAKKFSPTELYHLMTQTIIPRPIAWILTQNEDGKTHNFAPFSYFNAVCSDPPLVMFSCAVRPNGELKDTVINTLREERLVIHIATASQVQAVETTAKPLEYGISELDASNLQLCDFANTGLQRVQGLPIAFACRLYKSETIGNNNQTVIFAEIEQMYIDDGVIQDNEKYIAIDANKVEPLARYGRGQFSKVKYDKKVKKNCNSIVK